VPSARRTNTLVCFAVPQEASAFRRLRGTPSVKILLTGIGRCNAERSIRRALNEQTPSAVLTCGFAGALNPAFQIGDVLFSADDGSALAGTLEAAGAKAATFYCADCIVTSADDKRRCREESGADAVEMESAIIRKVCSERGIATATVRSISDAATEDLPVDFNKLLTPDQRLDFVKLAVMLLRSPRSVAGLLRLQKNSAVAARNLAAVLARALKA
jgi:adenosylhomocysteine nucleosidase